MLPPRGPCPVDSSRSLNCSVSLPHTACRWRYSRQHWSNRSAPRTQQQSRSAAAGSALPQGSSSAKDQRSIATQQQQQPPRSRSKLQAAQSFIQQHGIGAFLSYISVSNAVSVFMLSSAWILFTRTVGLTPLAPGQWPKFILFYGGAYAMQHVARPLKVAIGLAGASVGSAVIQRVAGWFDISDRTALVLLLVVQAMLLLSCLGCVAFYAHTLALAASSVG